LARWKKVCPLRRKLSIPNLFAFSSEKTSRHFEIPAHHINPITDVDFQVMWLISSASSTQ
jgi:hypothetical protein